MQLSALPGALAALLQGLARGELVAVFAGSDAAVAVGIGVGVARAAQPFEFGLAHRAVGIAILLCDERLRVLAMAADRARVVRLRRRGRWRGVRAGAARRDQRQAGGQEGNFIGLLRVGRRYGFSTRKASE